MKIKNLSLLGLATVLTLSSCGNKDSKKEDPKTPTELNGVWGMDQEDNKDGIFKIYFEFLNDRELKLHFRCAFEGGVNRHAKGIVGINVNENQKTISVNERKKFTDNDTDYTCEVASVTGENVPYELFTIDGEKALDLGGTVMNSADINEKLETKTFDETTQHYNPFVSTEASVIAK